MSCFFLCIPGRSLGPVGVGLALLAVASCKTEPSADPQDSASPTSTGAETSSPTTVTDTATSSTTAPVVPGIDSRLSVRDYALLYWPTNFRPATGGFATLRHLETGYYGAAFDVATGSFTHLGLVHNEVTPEQALMQGRDVVESMADLSVTHSVDLDGQTHLATGFANSAGDTANPSELIDMGRFLQRLEVPDVSYATASDLSGSVQLAAAPRHFVLTQRAARTDTGPLTLRMQIGGAAVNGFTETTWLEGSRAVAVHDPTGQGWSFVLPEVEGATSSIVRDVNGDLTLEMVYDEVQPDEAVGISVVGIPSNAATTDETAMWIHPQSTVTVQSAQLNRDGTGGKVLEDATWDPERGVYVLALHDLSEVGAPGWQDWADLNIHNWYNRHRVRISHSNPTPLSVPVALEGGNNAAFYIVGGSPLWRDVGGEPMGAPIQISKNWHETPFWYHLYSALELPAGDHELELTFAHAKWGNAYAAAHSQLSLVGWGTNQQWDESSLGAFGESITYDPDLTLNRSMVDDVRPLLVDAGSKWGWTGNVGGADFLTYVDNQGTDQRLSRMKTHYAMTGPNLTDVIYAGITPDGKIQARISTQLGRTDDLVRAYYHLDYTVLEEVEYSRLALFQVAADGYSDNGFTKYAYGNTAGYEFDGTVPAHGTTGYATDADRGLPMVGDAPWCFFYASDKSDGNLPENLANVGFIVRDFAADLGGTALSTPHLNLIRTFNNKESQMACELGLPYDPTNLTIPAGSRITATVEYVVPPADKSAYYGEADYLTALPEADFQSTEMMLLLARDNQLTVDVDAGTLVRTYPIEIIAANATTAAEFTLTGGLGFTPLTIRDLTRPDGWRLEQLLDGAWTEVDQAVEGNDYWQAFDAPERSGFDLVFNLWNRGTNQYRVIRQSK